MTAGSDQEVAAEVAKLIYDGVVRQWTGDIRDVLAANMDPRPIAEAVLALPALGQPQRGTDRAGDGHRMAAAEGHGSGKCVSVEDANRVLADERRGRDALIAAAEQRGRDETARKVWELAALWRCEADADIQPGKSRNDQVRATTLLIAADTLRALADRSEATP